MKLVGGNGTFTAENKQIKTSHLPADTIAELLTIIEAHELNYLADSEWDYSFKGDMNHPIYRNISQLTAKNMELSEISNMCKLVLFEPNEQVIEAVAKLDVAITHYKSENAIDIAPKNVNKVHGLKELGITEFIAFGNDANDECLVCDYLEKI